jgi:hypothetical protein
VTSLVEPDRVTEFVLLDRLWGLIFSAIGVAAMYGIFADATPRCLAVRHDSAVLTTRAVSFWPL